jgi:hypothetical protein
MDRPWNARQFDRVGAVIAMDQNGYLVPTFVIVIVSLTLLLLNLQSDS